MAIYRKIHTSFWGDAFIQELTPEQKYFYLYLLTNEKTAQCGIYEITTKQMCYDTGYNIDTINKLLKFFQDAQKVMYSPQTNELGIRNWDKFNGSDSGTVKTLVNQQLKSVKDRVLIEYIQSKHTTSIINNNITPTITQEPTQTKNDVTIPKKSDFLQYVKERCATVGEDFKLHEKIASDKYDSWVINGWKDGLGNKIGNWKGKVVSNLQYFKVRVNGNHAKAAGKEAILEIPKDLVYENKKL